MLPPSSRPSATALWVPDVGGDLFGAVGTADGSAANHRRHRDPQHLDAHGDRRRSAIRRTDRRARQQVVARHRVSHARFVDRARQAGTISDRWNTSTPTSTASTQLIRPCRRTSGCSPPSDRGCSTSPATHRRHPPVPRDAGAHSGSAGDARGRACRGRRAGRGAGRRPAGAHAIARQHLATYLDLPNYTNNWKRAGFTDDDLGGGGSDRLVDALYAWGDDAAIARRVGAHRDAGATHVCVQVVAADPAAFRGPSGASPRHWSTAEPHPLQPSGLSEHRTHAHHADLVTVPFFRHCVVTSVRFVAVERAAPAIAGDVDQRRGPRRYDARDAAVRVPLPGVRPALRGPPLDA